MNPNEVCCSFLWFYVVCFDFFYVLFNVVAEVCGEGFALCVVFGFCHFSVVVKWEFGVYAYYAFWRDYVGVGYFSDFWKFLSYVHKNQRFRPLLVLVLLSVVVVFVQLFPFSLVLLFSRGRE
jgi:hypothetical protein